MQAALQLEQSTPTTSRDRFRALGMLRSVGALDHQMMVVVHDGDPASKARARIVRGHAYTPAKTTAAQKSLAERMVGVRFLGNVAVACVFHRSNRQRIDIDNLMKLVLDAATQADVWDDDSQVTAVVAALEHDPGHPRTVVAFAPHTSTMLRGPDSLPRCAACGNVFDPYGQPRRRHCSRECRMTLAEPVPCPQCGVPFKRRTGNNKYCSVACRGLAARRRKYCECGALLSKTSYGKCRACWLREGPRSNQFGTTRS